MSLIVNESPSIKLSVFAHLFSMQNKLAFKRSGTVFDEQNGELKRK